MNLASRFTARVPWKSRLPQLVETLVARIAKYPPDA
jgi:hypothetical protein